MSVCVREREREREGGGGERKRERKDSNLLPQREQLLPEQSLMSVPQSGLH